MLRPFPAPDTVQRMAHGAFWTSVTVLALIHCGSALAASQKFIVPERQVTELAPVFGTVEGVRILPARARIAGTVQKLDVKEGDFVGSGEELAIVADSTLLSRQAALAAAIKGAEAQRLEAQQNFTRVQRLIGVGAVSQSAFDQARSALHVAESTLASDIAQHETIARQIAQGAVLAPHAGLVIHTPVSAGSVMMPGDIVAEIAEAPFRIRLAVPERYTRFVKKGALIRVDGSELGIDHTMFGRIDEIKPAISDGRVIAYASVPDLPDRFVGIKVAVLLPAQKHRAIVIPASYILTLSGSDYVLMQEKTGAVIDVPVQRGAARPSPQMPNGIEILSGLRRGDVLVEPKAEE